MPNFWDELYARYSEPVDVGYGAEGMEGQQGVLPRALATAVPSLGLDLLLDTPIEAGLASSGIAKGGMDVTGGMEGISMDPTHLGEEAWIRPTAAMLGGMLTPGVMKGYGGLTSPAAQATLKNQAGLVRFYKNATPELRRAAAGGLSELEQYAPSVSKFIKKDPRAVVDVGFNPSMDRRLAGEFTPRHTMTGGADIAEINPAARAFEEAKLLGVGQEALEGTTTHEMIAHFLTNPGGAVRLEPQHFPNFLKSLKNNPQVRKWWGEMSTRFKGKGLTKSTERYHRQQEIIAEAIQRGLTKEGEFDKRLIGTWGAPPEVAEVIQKDLRHIEGLVTSGELELYKPFGRGGRGVGQPPAQRRAQEWLGELEKTGKEMSPQDKADLIKRVEQERLARPPRGKSRDPADAFIKEHGTEAEKGSYIDRAGVKRREPGQTKKKGSEALDKILGKVGKEIDDELLRDYPSLGEGPKGIKKPLPPKEEAPITPIRREDIWSKKRDPQVPTPTKASVSPGVRAKLPRGPQRIEKLTKFRKQYETKGLRTKGGRSVADETIRGYRMRGKKLAAKMGKDPKEVVARLVEERLKDKFTPEEIRVFVGRALKGM